MPGNLPSRARAVPRAPASRKKPLQVTRQW